MKLNEAIEVLKDLKRLSTIPMTLREGIDTILLDKAIDTVVAELEKPLPTDEQIEQRAKELYPPTSKCTTERSWRYLLMKRRLFIEGAKCIRDLIRDKSSQVGDDTNVTSRTYTVEDMKSAWESGCLVGCEQENDIIYNREKSNYLTFERWIEGRNQNDSRNS